MRKKKVEKAIFTSEQEAAIVLEQYKQLLNHPAWNRIKDYYKQKIAIYQEELISKEITSIDQLERLRDKIKLCTQMMNLPEILITNIEINKDMDTNIANLDPFA